MRALVGTVDGVFEVDLDEEIVLGAADVHVERSTLELPLPLVVAAAGNDGPAGPTYGSISGPGGSPSALTVGAADLRARFGEVRVVLRAGLSVDRDDRTSP